MAKRIPTWIAERLDPIELLLRLVVGAVFLDSAWGKLHDPMSFSDVVRNYRILEDPWIAWLAMGMPVFLFIVGLCTVARVLYPACVIAATCALAGFVAALSSLMVRGIDIECGCLSFRVPISVQILIDVVLIGVCAVLVWLWLRRRRAVTR